MYGAMSLLVRMASGVTRAVPTSKSWRAPQQRFVHGHAFYTD